MRKFALTALGAAALGLAACGDTDVPANNAFANDTGAVTDTSPDSATTTTSTTSNWQGARIVEESGVTYRVDPDGTRVVLGPNDSRIVVEDDVRYRVDPDGTRVRIDDDGIGIDLPDVDVGVNEKGNLDVDVGDRDPDGGR